MFQTYQQNYKNVEIKLPELSLVFLIGVSGAGKSSFAKRFFQKNEIISSDDCRGWVSNNENDQTATKDAFELLNFMVEKRLKNGLLTVIDATNVQPESRKSLVNIAKKYHTFPCAIVLDLPENVCQERNTLRNDRNFGTHVIRQQRQQLRKSLKYLKNEGFRHIHTLKTEEEINNVTGIIREKLYSNKKDETGKLDIIGDIHGCFEELVELLEKLEYHIEKIADDNINFGYKITRNHDRKIVFLGDLVDRGEHSPKVLRLVMSMINDQIAYCVCGNHDIKLQKHLAGKNVQIKYGLAETLEQLADETPEFKAILEKFLYSLTSHYVFDNGKLVVAHAGIKEEMQGRGSGVIRDFCLYGETTGEIDEFGLPIRYNWAKGYKGKAKVVYGHTPVSKAEWFNNTIDIDTGCVFGGQLTALRYPEETLVQIPAKKVYYQSSKPLDFEEKQNTQKNLQQTHDDLLHIEDVLGKKIIQTSLRNNVTIQAENSIVALEIMSRFAVNPKWLIYLPPTMSPCPTSELVDYLEYPTQALNYFKNKGIKKVVCEEKHMGSRAILVICKDEKSVLERFGIENEGIGVCYTRTGRNFFNDKNLEKSFLNEIQIALNNTNFWEKFNTNWVCLDAELMPWSAKAQELIKSQYASVGASAKASLGVAMDLLQKSTALEIPQAKELLEKITLKKQNIDKYTKAYQKYCWEINTIYDYKLAPFHILATENEVHTDKNHEWHITQIAELSKGNDKIMMPTSHKIIDLEDENNVKQAINWWLELTQKGGEGMVVKPFDFIARNHEHILQPAIKCRGREYLRIIYGAEYTNPNNLQSLKNRGLSKKQSLALREFALGVEALERFVKKMPLRQIHECIFGILALESEEIDPRL